MSGWRIAMVLTLSLLLAGCGSGNKDTWPVKGKVTYRNKPVTAGTITFIPADNQGPAATGNLQPDGTYTLKTYRDGDGAVRGKHKVVVVAMEDTSDVLPEQRAATPPPTVPIKYTSIATSDLTAEVAEKDNTFDFELKD